MHMIMRYARSVSFLLIIAMTMLSLPRHQARAATAGGESGQRETAVAQLDGDSDNEALTREESLTEDEAPMDADDQLAAGDDDLSVKDVVGGIIGVVLVAGFLLLAAAAVALTIP